MKNRLLATKLRELRKLHNYNQDDVASVLGVVRQTYSHYETGKRTPNISALRILAGLYNISVDNLTRLITEVDNELAYEVPINTKSSDELSQILEYFSNSKNQKKYQFHTVLEKRLLFYFEKLSEADKNEIIEFTKIKAQKRKYKE